MEVHHTHASHGKKTWRAYFWEFLMLFLAVFCGFLAENQREHYVEHQREKKFAGQLLNDLRKDSIFYIYFSNRNQAFLKRNEKLKQLLTQQPAGTDKEVINAFLSIFSTYDLQLTNTTFTQMKTSGSLRYVRNEDLASALQEYYDVLIKRYSWGIDLSQKFFNDYMQPFFLNHFKLQEINATGDSVINPNAVMMDRSAKTDQQLLNITYNYAFIENLIIQRMNDQAVAKANKLIALLKKEYHLE